MPWKCPSCDEEINSLNYTVNTVGSEYGDATLSNSEPGPGRTNREIVVDHDYSDSGDNNWDGEPDYTCPECSDDIVPSTLIWIEPEEIEEEEKPKNLEEESHNIIKPITNIIRSNDSISRDLLDFTLICKKCNHIFVYDAGEDHYRTDLDKQFYECPNCATQNSPSEFLTLLKEGFFNPKSKTHKHVRPNTNKKSRRIVAKRWKIHR